MVFEQERTATFTRFNLEQILTDRNGILLVREKLGNLP
jgi:hypothetical protein